MYVCVCVCVRVSLCLCVYLLIPSDMALTTYVPTRVSYNVSHIRPGLHEFYAPRPCVAVCCVCCSVLQCAAVCCSVMQCVAVCVPRARSMKFSVLQSAAVDAGSQCCNVLLQCVAVSCRVL